MAGSRSKIISAKNVFEIVAKARALVQPQARRLAATVTITQRDQPEAFAAWVSWAETNRQSNDEADRRRAAFIRKMVDQHQATQLAVPSEWPSTGEAAA